MNMWRFLHYIYKLSLFQSDFNFSNEVNFKFWAHLTTWPLMIFDLVIWPLTAWTYKGSHIVSINQVWLQLDFNFSNEATFTFSSYLTTWPWYVTFDLINKCRFPCCIYDPTLVEIHQSMWEVEPNVNLFSQKTTTDKSGQSEPCVSRHKKKTNSPPCVIAKWLL